MTMKKICMILLLIIATATGWAQTETGNDAKSNGIADTYWRNEQTGDWLIGFAPKHVVYQNQVLDIISQTAKKDAYTLTVSDGTIIRVGKAKNGQRSISIGNGKPIACSQITGETLPDYPTKDLRTGFVDNGYQQGDSVTLIGWLKDMPEEEKAKGQEFEVIYENILNCYKSENACAKMDSLGRFTLKIPTLNSMEVFMDWRRSAVATVLEPGKTYFFLYDFQTGQQLWMGDDVRVQNELLAYPFEGANDHISDEEYGKISAMEFKARTDSTRTKNLNALKTCIEQHPNLSQRYIDFLTGYYLIAQGHSMMQGRYYMPAFKLPQEYVDFVSREVWQKFPLPYTLYRDFPIIIHDYIDHLYDENSPKITEIIRRLEQRGDITLTAEESAILNDYQALRDRLETDLLQARDGKEMDALTDEFSKNEIFKRYRDLYSRLSSSIQKESILSTFPIIDAVAHDSQLRDICIAQYLSMKIDEIRHSLDSDLMEYARQNIKTPALLAAVESRNEKYLALERRDITKASSLKSNDDVANMSDGEKILRKITEPYRGKLILLDIWGTWCTPCKEALSHSAEEFERLKDYDLVYLYLASRSSDESWKNVIKEYDLTGDNIVHYNLPANQQRAVEHFVKVASYPTYRLIDRDGTVLDVNADPRDLEGLARLLEQMKQE